MKNRSRGFTLIELMVVVALVAIMLAIAVPSFASFISSYRATAAINDILQAVTQTRTEALKRGRRVTLAPIAGDWTQGWTVFVEPTATANQVYSSGDELIYQHGPLPSSMTVAGANNTGTPFASNYLIFDGTGYPRTATGQMIAANTGISIVNTTGLSSATQYRTLCVAVLGRPRIVKAIDPCTSG
jgi:type IV fimbrial biogenesis protein FimT